MTDDSQNISSVRIADDALVVRRGQNRIQDLQRGIGTYPSGIRGVSVESAEGVSIIELSRTIPHRQIGVTTVGKIRELGGDVIRTSGRSVFHATLTGLTPEKSSMFLTPTILNPSRRER